MSQMNWNPLSEEDLNRIHTSSLEILEKTGMVIDHDAARKMLQEAGALVDHALKLVKFSPGMVEQALRTVPKTQIFAGRNSENDMILKVGGEAYLRTTSGPTSYIDLNTGEYRRAQIEDMKEFAILGDALSNIHCNGPLHAGDVPEQTADIHSLRVLLENSEKHLYTQCFSVKNLEYMIEMLVAVCGDRQALRQRPPLHIVIGIISPLYIPEDDVDMLLLAGKYAIPVGMCVAPSCGATSPLTLAATLAQGNAEMLGGITLAQLANPGHPTPYYWIPLVTDMQTGMGICASAETTIMNAALCQLGREFYGLPILASGAFCDTVIQGQSMFQKAQSALVAFLSGANLLLGAGSVETGLAFDPVQLVIDDEIMATTRRIWQGIKITDETLGLNVIHRVGPQGNFLSDEHTLKYLRTEEHFKPSVFSRDSYSSWLSKGKVDLAQRAREMAVSHLEKHEATPLTDEILKELMLITKKADEELAR